jgi:hypothetical protein
LPTCGGFPSRAKTYALKATEATSLMQVTTAPAAPDYALSIPKAAEIAGVSKRTMWRLIEDGKVKSIRASVRRRIIMMSELSRHLSEGVS